jgi:hypothetical protein
MAVAAIGSESERALDEGVDFSRPAVMNVF